jgi:hypothetical protein
MAECWAGTVPLEAESRFCRIQRYGHLPLLIELSSEPLDTQETAA